MSNLERTNVDEMDSEALSIELSTVISRRYLWIIKRICTIRKTIPQEAFSINFLVTSSIHIEHKQIVKASYREIFVWVLRINS